MKHQLETRLEGLVTYLMSPNFEKASARFVFSSTLIYFGLHLIWFIAKQVMFG